MNNLDSYVTVKQRFLKSINLISDSKEKQFLDSFVLQGSAMGCLTVMGSYLENTKQRAFTWTGPYGSGKSSLALFFSGMAQQDVNCITKYLDESVQTQSDPTLLDFFRKKEKWNVYSLVGRKGDLQNDITQALTLPVLPFREALSSFAKGLSKKNEGAVIFIDELGKFIENGNSENCYLLQEIAEFVNKSDEPIIFIGILHQAFEAYADPNSLKQQEEWMKVQGRFVDIPLVVSVDESLELISNSLEKLKKPPLKKEMAELTAKAVEGLTRTLKEKKILSKTLTDCWPLHPVTALLLGPISKKRFLQNTRSIFSFLCSKDIFGFDEFIRTTSDLKRLYSPWMLFDYLKANYEQAILASPSEGRKWLICEDCIERTEKNCNALELKIIKTIALLDLFRMGSGLDSNLETITASVNEASREEVVTGLTHLQNLRIIVFKSFRNAFSLYEGTDINIDERLKEIKNKNAEIPLSLITSEIHFQPIVAHKHYDETGALRWFNRIVVSKENLLKTIAEVNHDKRNGTLIVCLVDGNKDDLPRLVEESKGLLQSFNNPLVAISFTELGENLRNKLGDYFNSIELSRDAEVSDDKIASRELEERISFLNKNIFDELHNCFSRNSWLTLKELPNSELHTSDLGELVSRICEQAFHLSPIFNNELINRDKLSTQIRRAQKQLIRAMALHGDIENLGINGFPPEKMIYLSLLKATGIHAFDENLRKFSFTTEGLKNNFSSVFLFLSALFEKGRSYNLQELCDLLTEPPYGIKRGISPLLLLAFFLSKKREVSVYIENVFQSSVSDELLEIWTSSPKDISFKFIKNNPSNRLLISNLASYLGLTSEQTTALEVSRELVRRVIELPPWVYSSLSIPAQERKLRDAILRAWDPISLLFEEVPKLVGSSKGNDIVAALERMFVYLESLQPKRFELVREKLYSLLAVQDGGFKDLQTRASKLLCLDSPLQLKSFIGRIANSVDEPSMVHNVLTVCIGKPSNKWSESEISAADIKMSELCLGFRKLEGLTFLDSFNPPTRAISIVLGDKNQFKDFQGFFSTKESDKTRELRQKLEKITTNFSKDEVCDAILSLLFTYVEKKR